MEPTLFVCGNFRFGSAPSCGGDGAVQLMAALQSELLRRGLVWHVVRSPCLAHCTLGPNIKAAPGGPLLHGCKADKAAEIVDGLLAGWTPRMSSQ